MSKEEKIKTDIFNSFSVDKEYFQLSNDNAKILDDKKFIYIFGKNGSGKTTLSKEIINKFKDEYSLYIFNKDYVQKNIYVFNSKEDSFKVNQAPKNRRNSFNLFLGKDLIELQEELKNKDLEIDAETKKFNSFSSTQEIFRTDLQKIKLQKTLTDLSYSNLNSEQKKEIKKIEIQNTKNIPEDFHIFLNEIIDYDHQKKFNKRIIKVMISIRDNIDHSKKINLLKKKKKVSELNMKFHNEAKKFFENDEIFFIKHKYSISELEDYIEKNSSDYLEAKMEKEKLKVKTEEKIKEIKKDSLFESKKKIYEKEINEMNNFISKNKKNNEKFIINYKDQMKKKQELKHNFSSWIEKNKYYLSDRKIDLKDILNKIEKLNKEKKEIDKEISKVYSDLSPKVTEKINNHIKSLSEENYNLRFKMGSNQKQKTLDLLKGENEENIKYISEGEKSIIALAYFLTDLELNIPKSKKKFIVFIDDPFDSNDHYKYFNFSKIMFGNKNFSNFIKSMEKNGVVGKIIVTTHNAQFLTSFTRTLCDANVGNYFKKMKDEQKKYFSLLEIVKKDNKISFKEINYNLLFMNEKNFIDFANELFDYLLDNRSDNYKDLQLIKLLACVLVKLCDFSNNDKRIEYKKYFSEFQEGESNTLDENHKQIQNTKIDFKNLQKECINEIIKKSNIKGKHEEVVEYLCLIKDKYQDAFDFFNQKDKSEINRKARINRIKHKIFYSTSLFDLLEE